MFVGKDGQSSSSLLVKTHLVLGAPKPLSPLRLPRLHRVDSDSSRTSVEINKWAESAKVIVSYNRQVRKTYLEKYMVILWPT